MSVLTCRVAAVALVASIPLAPLLAQAPAPRRADGTDATAATAILVDVVVRDRKGTPVTDLTPDDFEVFEDGVRQAVGSFRMPGRDQGGVFTGTTRRPADAGTPPASAAEARPTRAADSSVVALVFDRLSPDSRRLTQLAAERYLGTAAQTNNVTGIFAADWGLEVIQGFTRDAGALRQALARVGARTGSQTAASRADARSQMERVNAVQDQISVGNTGAGAGGAVAGLDLQVAEIQQRMAETFDMLERDQQGLGTMNALTAVVNALKLVPGRKSVMFFSEGLLLPPNVQPRFLSLIDEANRANVAIYAMDAKGLRAESTQAEARDEINAYAQGRLRGDSQIGAGGAASRYLERNEDRLRQDPASGLGQLAQETGGFLIQGSNDFDKGFRRVDEDVRSHYVLTYASSAPGYDGRFRTIDVRVKRDGLFVAHRKGYYAVPPTNDAVPVLSFEAPALALLDSAPLPNAFPVTTRALLFPQGGTRVGAPLLVAFETKHLDYTTNADGTFAAEAVVVARVRDGNGQVVAKVSEQYSLSGPAAGLEASRAGRIVFFKRPLLPAGVHSLETIVYDTHTARASVRISSLDVPAPDAAPVGVSSVFVVQRAEKVPAAERDASNPLYFGELLLYPNMGEPLSKAASRDVAFAFAIYPSAAPVSGATVTLAKNGHVLGQAPLALDAPDAAGRIGQVGRLPIDTLEPGAYEIRLAVQSGTTLVSRSTRFTVVP